MLLVSAPQEFGLGAVGPTSVPGSLDDPRLELQARLFRELMSDPRSASPETDDSSLAHTGTRESVLHVTADSGRPDNVDVSSLLHSAPQASIATVEMQAPAATADPEPTFAELVERHVRRSLATRATSRQESDEVRLEMTDAVLPETQLSLRRSPDGWHLLAVTGDRGSLERLEQFAPALVKRFANASLGSLEVVARLGSRVSGSESE
jgi:hypothetical protein